MCFSVEVEKELQKLARYFKAQQSEADYIYFESLKQKAEDREWVKAQLKLKQKPRSSIFKEANPDHRIYPGYFTSVIVQDQAQCLLKPMRYRLRPAGSHEEIPSKFNVFNARLDSLENRPTWSPLFMRQHGIFPFKRFFEWVEDAGKPRLISFAPENRGLMWAPCLWDYWESPDKSLSFHSFALITDDPPPEIKARGHDRCPIFLKEDKIQAWLNPQQLTKSEIYRLLKSREEVTFGAKWVESTV